MTDKIITSADSDPPLVSVVIVNFNGKKYLENCLNAVYRNNYPHYEVVVVDNGSTDSSMELLDEMSNSNPIKIIKNKKNFGPAYARNRGAEVSNGKYIAFLDNDTEPDANWLIESIKAMEKDETIGACQCKLLIMSNPNHIDYIGDYISPLGFLIQKAEYGEIDNGRHDAIEPIFAAKSAAMVIRHDVLDEIGPFDEDFFIYIEETDVCWRVWLGGYKTVFIPRSIVIHAGGVSGREKSEEAKYKSLFHGCKNYISTLIKNLNNRNLVKIVPIHISCWLAIGFYSMLRLDFSGMYYILKGVTWNIFNLGNILKKRRVVQKRIRKVSDDTIFINTMKRRELGYFLKKPKKAFDYLEKIENQ